MSELSRNTNNNSHSISSFMFQGISLEEETENIITNPDEQNLTKSIIGVSETSALTVNQGMIVEDDDEVNVNEYVENENDNSLFHELQIQD